jgi:hypothetical protein
MKISHFALAGLFLLLAAGIYLTMKTEMDGQVEQLKADNERKFEQYEKAQKENTALLAKTIAATKEKEKEATAVVAESPKVSKPKAQTTPEDPAVIPVKKPVKPVDDNVVASAPPTELLPPPGSEETLDSAEARIIAKEQRELLNNKSGVNDDRIAEEDGKITNAIPEGEHLTRSQSRVKALPSIARVKEVKEADGFVVLDAGSNVNLAKGDKFSVRRGTFILGSVTVSDTVRPTECVADVNKLIDGAALQKGDEIIKWDR